ncbi:MAG TPA: hypothetical protein VMH81_00550 [Bryobacteraceae bacterium]|nr:hypothetical protein [Bryobacteraceae bacterium]
MFSQAAGYIRRNVAVTGVYAANHVHQFVLSCRLQHVGGGARTQRTLNLESTLRTAKRL